MSARRWRIAGIAAAIAASATLGTLVVGASPASAVTRTGDVAVTADQSYSADAVFRGYYRTYYDCDIAGFTGIYYGWWTGYFCNWVPSAGAWALYA